MKIITDFIYLVVFFVATLMLGTPISAMAVKCPLPVNGAYLFKGSSSVYFVTKNCTKQVFSGPTSFLQYFNSWKKIKNVSKTLVNKIAKDINYIIYPRKINPPAITPKPVYIPTPTNTSSTPATSPIVQQPVNSLPSVPIQPTPSVTETLSYPSQFTLPNRIIKVGDWTLTITPTIAYKDSQISFVLTTDNVKRGNVTTSTLSLSQMPVNGMGKTENLQFYNDGTHGDQLSNDRYFTASTQASEWYRSVLVGTLNINYRDGSQETFNLIGEVFSVLDVPASDIVIYSTPHITALVQNSYKDIGRAYAHSAELCYSGLKNQIGDFNFPLGSAYYIFYQSSSYLETGGPLNTVKGSEQFLAFPASPTSPEWNSCNPITSHELTHTIFDRVPKVVWADEGLAEYTAQAISGDKIVCEASGWRKNASDSLHSFVNINQDAWQVSQDSYMTGVCVYRYIEDTYGQQAIQKIYTAMKNYSSYEHLPTGFYCGRNFNFYQNVLVNSTNQNILNILQQRFGIKSSQMQC